MDLPQECSGKEASLPRRVTFLGGPWLLGTSARLVPGFWKQREGAVTHVFTFQNCIFCVCAVLWVRSPAQSKYGTSSPPPTPPQRFTSLSLWPWSLEEERPGPLISLSGASLWCPASLAWFSLCTGRWRSHTAGVLPQALTRPLREAAAVPGSSRYNQAAANVRGPVSK